MRRFFVLLLSLSFCAAPAVAGCMDTDNQFWLGKTGDRTTYDRLMKLMACPADAEKDEGRQIDAIACNWFVAKAIDELFGIKDFRSSGDGRWLSANEIVTWVRGHPSTWSKLGNADDQATLDNAAQGTKNGQLVIATLTGDPHGHVALILAGEQKFSSTWSRLVPNSAAFSLNNVNKAYVFCRLSAAFSNPSEVEIYWRVKN
jgi:hypothetical protein